MTDTDTMIEIITRYNEARKEWIDAKGDDFCEEEFHAWFTLQVEGGVR
jgi:hypothetical protein